MRHFFPSRSIHAATASTTDFRVVYELGSLADPSFLFPCIERFGQQDFDHIDACPHLRDGLTIDSLDEADQKPEAQSDPRPFVYLFWSSGVNLLVSHVVLP
jgi:hypothetical protein